MLTKGVSQRSSLQLARPLEPGEEAGCRRADGLAAQLGELAQQPLLLVGELVRGLYRELDQQVAAAAAVGVGDAALAEALHRARLGARVDLDGLLAVEGDQRERPAEGGHGHRHGQLADQVVVAPGEDLVGDHVELDVEVAGRAAELAGVAAALVADAHPVVEAGWDVDGQLGVLRDPALALAARARRQHLVAAAAAGHAGAGGDELAEQGLAHGALLAAAVAGLQVVAAVPDSVPWPPQSSHGAMVRTRMSLELPKTASENSRWTRMARSSPRRARERVRVRVANGSPPKKASTTSANVPKPNGSAGICWPSSPASPKAS